MKLKNILTLLVFFALFSCSKTNVIYPPIIIDDTVDADPVAGQFTKHVLIEDFTGTWCGNCTRVSYSIDKVLELTNRAVPVAIHNGNDPYHFDGIEPLRNQIYPNFSSFPLPTVRLNRTIIWTYPENLNIPQAKNLTSNNSGLGIAMNSELVNNMIDLDVNIKFAQNYSNLRMVVYLLESGLIYDQRNYTDLYGANNNPTIPNYQHNHVLRNSLTNILGDAVVGETLFGKTVTKTFSMPVPAAVENNTHISFVAFLIDSNNTVINCRSSEINEVQTFEENP